MFLKIDALCPYMAHCLSFLPNYSGVAVRGALTYGSYFLSGEVETVLGSVLPQAISVDLWDDEILEKKFKFILIS